MVAISLVHGTTMRALLFQQSYSTWAIAILAVIVAMIWILRGRLSGVPAKPSWVGLIGVALAGAAWWISQLSLVRPLGEYALVLMLPMSVLAVFGYRWARALAPALALFAFVIPLGGPLIPWLVETTANCVVHLLQATGVLVYREGAYLQLSTGMWSIADTCSGIGFFNAAIVLAIVFATFSFESNLRRAVVVTGAIVVAVTGNWIRVYLTILIAHLSDNRYLRADHEMAGWILFLTFLYGYGFAALRLLKEMPSEPNPRQDELNLPISPPPPILSVWPRVSIAIVIAMLAATFFWPLSLLLVRQAEGSVETRLPSQVPSSNWQVSQVDSEIWRPIIVNPRAQSFQSYRSDGSEVFLAVAIYRAESWQSKLVARSNRVAETDDRTVTLIARHNIDISILKRQFTANEFTVMVKGEPWLVWQWYWTFGGPTGSMLEAKYGQLRGRLTEGDDAGIWYSIATPVAGSRTESNERLRRFVDENGSILDGDALRAMQPRL